MGNRTNYGTGRMTVDNRQKNERSRSGNPYSSHVKAGKHAGTVYNFKRKSRIRKSLTRLPILLEFIHKYIFLNFVSFYNGLNSNLFYLCIFINNPVISIPSEVTLHSWSIRAKFPLLFPYIFFLVIFYPPFSHKICFTFSVSRSSQKIRFMLFRLIPLPAKFRLLRYKYNSLTLKPMIIRLNMVSTASRQ